jgi:hypothetical protein
VAGRCGSRATIISSAPVGGRVKLTPAEAEQVRDALFPLYPGLLTFHERQRTSSWQKSHLAGAGSCGLYHTQDFQEGRKAEAEGRPPVYHGN